MFKDYIIVKKNGVNLRLFKDNQNIIITIKMLEHTYITPPMLVRALCDMTKPFLVA